MKSRASFSDVPIEVISAFVCPYLGPKQLCRLSCVSRDCNEAASCGDSAEEVWSVNCERRWKGKAGMPQPHKMELYPWAIYSPTAEARFTIRELKMILLRRSVDPSNLLERSEFIQKLRETNPTEVQGWKMLHGSKWKTSFVYSVFDSTRTRITRRELTTSSWTLTFKGGSGSFDVRFNADGTFWSSLRSHDSADMPWVLDNKHETVRVGPYPALHITREKEHWDFRMENNHVIMRQDHP